MAALLVRPSTAPGAAPSNDSPGHFQPLELPSTLNGTTKGASTDQPGARCAAAKNDVWYGFTSRREGPVFVRLHALGDLDGVVAVFRQARSRFYPVACGTVNAKGLLLLPFYTHRGRQYVVQVAQRTSSRSGDFRMRVFRADPPARPPGPPLPTQGVRSSVRGLVDADDSWSVEMERGHSYRANLIPGKGCLSLQLFRPDAYSFRLDTPVFDLDCGGYTLFTPGPDGGGRYSFRVVADGDNRDRQPYRLHVAPAEADDVAPGLPLSTGAVVSGSLSGRGIDLVDLYRFGAAELSVFRAQLTKPPRARFTVKVLTLTGETVSVHEHGAVDNRKIVLRKKLPHGHYYLAVQSEDRSGGPYRLELSVQGVTRTGLLVNGASSLETDAGRALALSASVVPSGSGGSVRFQFDRDDPLTGWHFVETKDVPIGGGFVTTSWTPPTVGYWRVRARFLGTIRAAPSGSDYVRVMVSDPLIP